MTMRVDNRRNTEQERRSHALCTCALLGIFRGYFLRIMEVLTNYERDEEVVENGG